MLNIMANVVATIMGAGDVYQAPLLQKYGRPIRFYVKRKLLGPDALERFCRFSVDDEPESEEQVKCEGICINTKSRIINTKYVFIAFILFVFVYVAL
jgi:hypothetical protein